MERLGALQTEEHRAKYLELARRKYWSQNTQAKNRTDLLAEFIKNAPSKFGEPTTKRRPLQPVGATPALNMLAVHGDESITPRFPLQASAPKHKESHSHLTSLPKELMPVLPSISAPVPAPRPASIAVTVMNPAAIESMKPTF